jgi:NTE family protein
VARIGLVLGAGGVVGQAFHAGVLAALEEVTGWDPRSASHLVGTSAGSVAAASLCAGVSGTDLYARATGRPLTPAGSALLDDAPPPPRTQPVAAPVPPARLGPSSPELLVRLLSRPLTARAPVLAVTALLPEGRRDTTDWFRGFDGWFGDGRWPDSPDRHLWICALDLGSGRRVVFGREPPPGVLAPAASPAVPRVSVSQAVQASCAIPAVFRPVVIDGRRYVDGGVHSPTNADLLVGESVEAVIVSSPMSAAPLRGGPPFSVDRLRLATRLPARRALFTELRRLGVLGVPVLVFEPTTEVLDEMGLQPMDFRRRAPVAEASLAAARSVIDSPAGREVGRLLRRSA